MQATSNSRRRCRLQCACQAGLLTYAFSALCLGMFEPGVLTAQTFSGTNSTTIVINDNSAATPYPSSISVTGLSQPVSHLTVTVWGLEHTFSSDISMLLVGPQGQAVVLMSVVGDTNNTEVSVNWLTFDDSAPAHLPFSCGDCPITNGSYQPTDAGIRDFFFSPAPSGPYKFALSAFNGTVPNGTWSLYVEDTSPGDVGIITNGWSLSITTGSTAFGISGTVTTYNSNISVPAVTMNVTGDANTAGLTDTNGTYAVLVNMGGTYTVTPQKTDDNPTANGVTTADIALIRRHILNTTPLDSPYKLLAADVTGAGSVTDMDIAFIRQLILALTNSFPAGLWKFVPTSYLFPDPQHPWTAPNTLSYANVVADASNQNYLVMKLGDVNSSWAVPAVSQTNAPLVQFRLANVTARPGDSIKAAITVAAFQNVTSIQFTMKWDPTVLQFVGVSDFALRGLQTNNFGTVFVNSGELTFSWDDPQGSGVTTADGTAIFAANFRASGPTAMSSLALVDSPTPREVTVDAALGTFVSQNGAVIILPPTVTPPLLSAGLNPTKTAFVLAIPTVNGVTYVAEYADVLPATNWTRLSTIVGDGTLQVVTDQILTNQSRFYRTRTL